MDGHRTGPPRGTGEQNPAYRGARQHLRNEKTPLLFTGGFLGLCVGRAGRTLAVTAIPTGEMSQTSKRENSRNPEMR